MTDLSLGATNFLLQVPEIVALVGKDSRVGPWIFDEKPVINIQSSQRSMIVVNQGDSHTDMASRKTTRFPSLIVDIWSDSDRTASGSVPVTNSTEKIQQLADLVLKHLHFQNPSVSPDDPKYYGEIRYPRVFGTAEQISDRTGVTVLDSLSESGDVSISQVRDSEGSEMGRLTFNLTVL